MIEAFTFTQAKFRRVRSKFQKMASKTSDIRKVDEAKMMLCRLVSNIIIFDPGMIPQF